MSHWGFQFEFGLKEPGISEDMADTLISYIGGEGVRAHVGAEITGLTFSFPVHNADLSEALQEAISRADLALRLSCVDVGDIAELTASSITEEGYGGSFSGLAENYRRFII